MCFVIEHPSIPAGYCQAMNKIVNAIGQKVEVANYLFSLLIAFVVVVGRTFFVRVFKYLLKDQKGQDSTCR